MGTAGRLVFQHGLDVKMVIDSDGNFFVKGDRRSSSSDDNFGLTFKSSTIADSSIRIKTSIQSVEDGVFIADFATSNVSAIPSGDFPSLVFAKGGISLVEFSYSVGNTVGVETIQKFICNFATRKNAAKIEQVERNNLRDAIIALDSTLYPDGVSYWDKQDQIHSVTHVHGIPSFLPWHRESSK